jgi:hypothetical protein
MLKSRRYHRDGNELPATLRRSYQEAQDTPRLRTGRRG